MNWTITALPCGRLRSPDGRARLRIKRTRAGLAACEAQDGALALAEFVNESGRCAITVRGRRCEGIIEFESDAQTSCFRAPMAKRLCFGINNSAVKITQLRTRDFTVEGDDLRGSVSGMQSLRANVALNSGDEALAAAVYMLANIMLHADDVDFV